MNSSTHSFFEEKQLANDAHKLTYLQERFSGLNWRREQAGVAQSEYSDAAQDLYKQIIDVENDFNKEAYAVKGGGLSQYIQVDMNKLKKVITTAMLQKIASFLNTVLLPIQGEQFNWNVAKPRNGGAAALYMRLTNPLMINEKRSVDSLFTESKISPEGVQAGLTVEILKAMHLHLMKVYDQYYMKDVTVLESLIQLTEKPVPKVVPDALIPNLPPGGPSF